MNCSGNRLQIICPGCALLIDGCDKAAPVGCLGCVFWFPERFSSISREGEFSGVYQSHRKYTKDWKVLRNITVFLLFTIRLVNTGGFPDIYWSMPQTTRFDTGVPESIRYTLVPY